MIVRTRVGASPAEITHYIYDIWGNIIAESDGSGPTGTVREYIYLPEAEIAPTFGSRTSVDRPIGVVDGVNTASPVLWFVHVDHLNRPVKMTDTAKAAVWDAVFLPWGGVHAITGSATLDARFPGQWFQLESGLHYNWHRQYDSTIGRYIQPDPLGFVDGPSVYGYAGASPQADVDLTGRNRARRPNVFGPSRSFRIGDGTPRPATSPNQCYIVTPGGTVLPIPLGAVGPVPVPNPAGIQTGTAFIGGPNGMMLRMMDPTLPSPASPGYPNGYNVYSNPGTQTVNPYSGQTIPRTDPFSHIRN